jgi:hypothetical protein
MRVQKMVGQNITNPEPEENGVFAGEDVNLNFSGDDAKAVFGILENLAENGYITPAKTENERDEFSEARASGLANLLGNTNLAVSIAYSENNHSEKSNKRTNTQNESSSNEQTEANQAAITSDRVKGYLCGPYKWTPYGQSSQTAVIEGLYFQTMPDNPRLGVEIFWAYNPVTIIMANSIKADLASKIVNNAWNQAVQDITARLNGRQIKPYYTFVKPAFEKLFTQYAKASGAQVYLDTVPYGVPFNDKTISYAKFERNECQ